MDNEIKKQNLATKLKWIIGLASPLLFAPLTFFILQGLLGMLALVAAATVGFACIQLAPVFAMKVANWRMKMIQAEAEKNPIETMKNIYLEKSRLIQEKDRKIVEFEGRLGDYHDKMVVFKKRHPEEASRYEEIGQKMNRALGGMKRKQAAAKLAQSEYKAEIEKAEDIYAMALAAHDVTELGADIEKQVFMDIKERVAFDSVNHKFNTAVAALSMEVDNQEDFQLAPAEKSDRVVDPIIPVIKEGGQRKMEKET